MCCFFGKFQSRYNFCTFWMFGSSTITFAIFFESVVVVCAAFVTSFIWHVPNNNKIAEMHKVLFAVACMCCVLDVSLFWSNISK